MTDNTPLRPTSAHSVATVESFLRAVCDDDFDAVAALSERNLVWQNVGLPTLRGRDRIVRFMRAGEGRLVIDMKIHRIAADGDTVLVERTDAWIVGRVACNCGCAAFSNSETGGLRCGATTSITWRGHEP